jgi:hypothetical protein
MFRSVYLLCSSIDCGEVKISRFQQITVSSYTRDMKEETLLEFGIFI